MTSRSLARTHTRYDTTDSSANGSGGDLLRQPNHHHSYHNPHHNPHHHHGSDLSSGSHASAASSSHHHHPHGSSHHFLPGWRSHHALGGDLATGGLPAPPGVGVHEGRGAAGWCLRTRVRFFQSAFVLRSFCDAMAFVCCPSNR